MLKFKDLKIGDLFVFEESQFGHGTATHHMLTTHVHIKISENEALCINLHSIKDKNYDQETNLRPIYL